GSRVCRPTARISCMDVLSSPAAKLFGWIPLSDIGLVYFAGSITALATSALSNDGALRVLAAFNLAALPYMIFSIYYQAFRLRRWCVLCVAVQIVLWLELLLLYGGAHTYVTTATLDA